MDILIKTTKNIMGIEKIANTNNYEFIYMFRDQILNKNNKIFFLRAYIIGQCNQKTLDDLLENQISIILFINRCQQLKQVIELNHKKTVFKPISDVQKFYSYLPEHDIYLKDMP